jgi:hypothetical protein
MSTTSVAKHTPTTAPHETDSRGEQLPQHAPQTPSPRRHSTDTVSLQRTTAFSMTSCMWPQRHDSSMTSCMWPQRHDSSPVTPLTPSYCYNQRRCFGSCAHADHMLPVQNIACLPAKRPPPLGLVHQMQRPGCVQEVQQQCRNTSKSRCQGSAEKQRPCRCRLSSYCKGCQKQAKKARAKASKLRPVM